MRLTLSIILVLFNFAVALGSSYEPNCVDPEVFCFYEGMDVAESSGSIESFIPQLPLHVLRNSTFKRGNNIEKGPVGYFGPHGHKTFSQDSQSASPLQPRVFVWDEASGFTASWNSGNLSHKGFDRVDLYGFDFNKKEHIMTAWLPGHGFIGANESVEGVPKCTTCHGQALRPIFPMYPDWPQFYGEFNDEMAGYPSGVNPIRSDLGTMGNQFQPIERALYAEFLAGEAKYNDRYTPLFTPRVKDNQDPRYPSNSYYPFRPKNHSWGAFSDSSRAFYHRPNLRLGLVYNRLTALAAFEKIKKAPLFQKYPDIVFYSLLDCNWDFVINQGQRGRQDILDPFLREAKDILGDDQFNLRGVKFLASEMTASQLTSLKEKRVFEEQEDGQTIYYLSPEYSDRGYTQIPYEDLLKIMELDIRDIDIRFNHNSSFKVSAGFDIYDPRAYHFTDSAMDIGYLNKTYRMNPVCGRRRGNACDFDYKNDSYMRGMKYFNSYFDGSATMNELLAAQMLMYLIDTESDFSSQPELADVRDQLRENITDAKDYTETLLQKYSGPRFSQRLALDRTFFNRMDAMSPWIQLPYPQDLYLLHNRESFWTDGSTATRNRHAQWTNWPRRASDIKNRSNNLCWSVSTSMYIRYRQP